MAAEVGSIFVGLTADMSGFTSSLTKAEGVVNRFGTRTERSLSLVQTRVSTLGKSVVGFGSTLGRTLVPGGLGIAGLGLFIKTAANAADAIDSTAKSIGITSEALQELQFVGSQLGVQMDESLNKSLQVFVRNLGDAQRGTGPMSKGLAALGLTLDDIRGKAPLDVISMIADRLAAIDDPARRASAAAAIFGKGWAAIAPMLSEGGKAIDDLRKKARDMGLVVSDEMIQKAASVADQFDMLGMVGRAAGINLAGEFLPAMKTLAAIMTSTDFQSGVHSFANDLGSAIAFIRDNIGVVERLATAFVAMRAGAALGGVAGKRGAVIGGVVGATAGFFAPEIKGAFGQGDQKSAPLELDVPVNVPKAKPVINTQPPDVTAYLDQKSKIDDVTQALAFAYEQMKRNDLEQQIYENLRQAGVSIDSAAGKQIAELTQRNYDEAESQKARQEALAETIRRMDEARDTAKDFLSTLVDGLRNGESWSDALRDAVGKLTDKLLDMAENQIITSLFGATGTAGGGLLSGLFSLLGFAKGGVVRLATGGSIRGAGTGTSDSIPALLSNGEFVVNAKASQRHRPLLEAINSGTARKLAGGGPVSRSERAMVASLADRQSAPGRTMVRKLGENGGETTVSVPVTFNGPIDASMRAYINAQMAQLKRDVLAQVPAVVAGKRAVSPSYMASP